MEKQIIEVVVKRNKILDEIIQLNHLAISHYSELSEDDKDHFLLTRKYMIEALIHTENEIIAYSMLDWSSFKFGSEYKEDYICLTKEKYDKAAIILEQDNILHHLMHGTTLAGDFRVA